MDQHKIVKLFLASAFVVIPSTIVELINQIINGISIDILRVPIYILALGLIAYNCGGILNRRIGIDGIYIINRTMLIILFDTSMWSYHSGRIVLIPLLLLIYFKMLVLSEMIIREMNSAE